MKGRKEGRKKERERERKRKRGINTKLSSDTHTHTVSCTHIIYRHTEIKNVKKKKNLKAPLHQRTVLRKFVEKDKH